MLGGGTANFSWLTRQLTLLCGVPIYRASLCSLPRETLHWNYTARRNGLWCPSSSHPQLGRVMLQATKLQFLPGQSVFPPRFQLFLPCQAPEMQHAAHAAALCNVCQLHVCTYR